MHRAAIAEKEDAVRSRLDTVTELSAKLTESLRANTGEEVTYYLVSQRAVLWNNDNELYVPGGEAAGGARG